MATVVLSALSFSGTISTKSYFHIFHDKVVKDPNFPENPAEALKQGFLEAENRFLSLV
jgi:hypothetical protein